MLARAAELFPNLADQELVAKCPPTTDEFRRWLDSRLTQFLAAGDALRLTAES